VSAIILSGFASDDGIAKEIISQTVDYAERHGGGTRLFHLADLAVGHCLGEFDCWQKTPGRCRIPDEGQEIERAVHDADLLVLLTPLSFGSYAATLKKALDRLIPLILPFFNAAGDLTHHAHRYRRLPRFVAIGYDPELRAERARLFCALVESNALNLGAPAWSAAVLGRDPDLWSDAIGDAFARFRAPGNASGSGDGARAHLREVMHAAVDRDRFPAAPDVVILTASPRPMGESTSASLAQFLGSRLRDAGASVSHLSATHFLRGDAIAEQLAAQVARADILVLASPLYCDSIPYPGLFALERIAAVRARGAAAARVVGMFNCGFPEPEQLRYAIATLRCFAEDAGYTFAGALPIGGGEVIAGRPLETTGGKTLRLRQALDEAAAALAEGGVIPDSASDAAARMFLPAALYRAIGWLGWVTRGLLAGMPPWDLRQRPFDDIDDEEWARISANMTRVRPLQLVSRDAETEDAVTLRFVDPAGHSVRYEAGQYVTLELPIAGERVRRGYSLAGGVAPGEWAITVKRVPGGLVSNYLHGGLPEGALVQAYGPSGRFTAGPRPDKGARRLLLVAGGSGIVPLAAIAVALLDEEADAQLSLVYGVSSPARAIYRDALEALARRHPDRFALDFVFETAPADWSGARGRITPALLQRHLASRDGVDRAMLCGPEPMRAAVRAMLGELGLPEAAILEESFTSPRRADVPMEAQAVSWMRGGEVERFAVRPGETLLEAALTAGVPISFSCCAGGCGACRVRIRDGLANAVLDEPNDVAAEARAAGQLPACITRLKGPISFTLD
jgi:ferredoxin-NADP reductase/multimeric flavodoxin WrbA